MRWLLAVGGLVATSTLALAQPAPARLTRPPFAPPRPTPVVREPTPAEPARPPLPTLPHRDALVLNGIGGQPRPETEQLLTQLIATTPDSEVDEKSDLYFRLAELYAQQFRIIHERAAKATADADAATDPALRARLRAEAQAATSKGKQVLISAVKTFKVMTTNDAFRTYPKLDTALFEYGYTLQLGGFMKEARAVYDQLLKTFPNSKFVPEAHLAFGEYYVTANDLEAATARYQYVLRFPGTSAYAYAAYQLGALAMQLQHPAEALGAFGQVVEQTAKDPRLAEIAPAGREAYVLAYAESGRAETAAATFARLDAAHAQDMLARLQLLYVQRGATTQAGVLDHALTAAGPTAVRRCSVQAGIARAQRTPEAQVRELELLVGAWRREFASPTEGTSTTHEARTCHDQAVALVGEQARALHAEAATTHAHARALDADRLYRAYLDAFPGEPDAATMRAYHAELLWTLAETEPKPRSQADRWAAAGDAFAMAATVAPDATSKSEAAHAALLAWANALGLDPRPGTQAASIDLVAAASAKVAVRPLAPRDVTVLASLERAARELGIPDEVARAELLAAMAYRRSGHHDQAVPRLAELLAHHRDHEAAELAATLLLDSLVRLRELDRVLVVGDELSADPRFLDGKPALASQLRVLRSRSLRRR